jgi:hypothetical protein
MKLKANFNQRPQVVGLEVSVKNADVVICTLEDGTEFGAHVTLFDEEGDPAFLDDENRLKGEYEIFTARTTGVLWIREKGGQRGFTW